MHKGDPMREWCVLPQLPNGKVQSLCGFIKVREHWWVGLWIHVTKEVTIESFCHLWTIEILHRPMGIVVIVGSDWRTELTTLSRRRYGIPKITVLQRDEAIHLGAFRLPLQSGTRSGKPVPFFSARPRQSASLFPRQLSFLSQ